MRRQMFIAITALRDSETKMELSRSGDQSFQELNAQLIHGEKGVWVISGLLSPGQPHGFPPEF